MSSIRTLRISSSFCRSRRKEFGVPTMLFVLTTLALWLCIGSAVEAFNLSPTPNIIFTQPSSNKDRSSYFGFTVNMQNKYIFIGSPRANSTFPKQSDINEPGAIYRCEISGACKQYGFEENGNILGDDTYNDDGYIKTENRTNQWLGASMDAGTDGSMVVCAPRLSTIHCEDPDCKLHNFGRCYLTNNVNDPKPKLINVFNPEIRSSSYSNQDKYSMAEQGISVHIADNEPSLLVGAPGVSRWRGSVVVYFPEKPVYFPVAAKRRRRSTPEKFQKLQSTVLDPNIWNLTEISYFGYAVSSGNFRNKSETMFVASAPHANLEFGQVHLFTVNQTVWQSPIVDTWRTLQGSQPGEFFGYALIAEDFNGDGWTDLVVSAPLHSFEDDTQYDHGAVYVYQNVNGAELEQVAILSTKVSGSRFGTTLSRIGDLNGDNYNDLVVAAPFEGRGAVYIYHGGPNGLSKTPSQTINAPNDTGSEMLMFGHGLSKGFDIDKNGVPDLAVGAPNVDTVYVFKGYPVAIVTASITTTPEKLEQVQSQFTIKACWKLDTNATLKENSKFNIELKLDPLHKRVTYKGVNVIIPTKDLTISHIHQECESYIVDFEPNMNLVYEKVLLQLRYNIESPETKGNAFCETCVKVNPAIDKFVEAMIPPDIQCKGAKCDTNLQVTSDLLNDRRFVRGSSNLIIVNFDVTNSGEASYVTKLSITKSETVDFARIPQNCHKISVNNMECDLKNGPLYTDSTLHQTIELDLKNAGKSFKVEAHSYSINKEDKNHYNSIVREVHVIDSSTVQIAGKSTSTLLSLDKNQDKANITHSFQIRNLGFSTIGEAEIFVSIPTMLWLPELEDPIVFINKSELSITYNYDGKSFTQLATTIINRKSSGLRADKIAATHKITRRMNENVHTDSNQDPFRNSEPDLGYRRRRDLPGQSDVTINHTAYPPNEKLFDDFVQNLDKNKDTWMHVDSSHPNAGYAVASFRVPNFEENKQTIEIQVSFIVNLRSMQKILNDDKDMLVLSSIADVIRVDKNDLNTAVIIETKRPYTVISKHAVHNYFWHYVASAIVGILLLTVITYIMHRNGFFERKMKKEIETLKRDSQAVALKQPTSDEE